MSEQPELASSELEPNHANSEVDALLVEFNGDARAAIAALLHDLDVLAADRASNVSLGYVRGRGLLRRSRL
jgi:hypothetical protein